LTSCDITSGLNFDAKPSTKSSFAKTPALSPIGVVVEFPQMHELVDRARIALEILRAALLSRGGAVSVPLQGQISVNLCIPLSSLLMTCAYVRTIERRREILYSCYRERDLCSEIWDEDHCFRGASWCFPECGFFEEDSNERNYSEA
jgi:hypothetical protein